MKNVLKRLLCVTAVVFGLMSMLRSAYAGGECSFGNQLSVTAYVAGLPDSVLEVLNSGKHIKMQIIYAWHQEGDFGSDITYRRDDAIDVCCRATDDKEQYKIRHIFYEADALHMALDFPYGYEAIRFLKNVSGVQDENFSSADAPFYCYLKIIRNPYVMTGNAVYPCVLKFPLEKSVQLSVLARCNCDWSSSTFVTSLERGEPINVIIIYDYPWVTDYRPRHTLDSVCTCANGVVSKPAAESSTFIKLSFPCDKRSVDFIDDILQSGHFEKNYGFCIEHDKRRIQCFLDLPLEIAIQEIT